MVNKEEIIHKFEFGKKFNPIYMIIFYDNEKKICTTRYVRKDENVDDIIINKLRSESECKVVGIYNYQFDIENQIDKAQEYNNNLINYDIALNFASNKHKDQYRKGKNITKPYIEHPISVSKLVENYMKYDIDVEKYKIAALLHDTLEDTDTTYDELKSVFNENIANIVSDVTNDKKKIKKQGKDVYLSKKLSKLEERTLTLKLCDRLDNINDLVITNCEFRIRYIQETLYIIDYLLLNRELTSTHLRLINDITTKISEIAKESKLDINVKRKTLKIEKK